MKRHTPLVVGVVVGVLVLGAVAGGVALYAARRVAGGGAGGHGPGLSERLAAEQTAVSTIRADGTVRTRVHLTFELLAGDRPPTLFLYRPQVPDPVDTPSVPEPVDVTGADRVDTTPVPLTMTVDTVTVRRPGGSAERVGVSRVEQDDWVGPGWRLTEPMGGWTPGRYAVDLDARLTGGVVDERHLAFALPTWAPGGVGGGSFTTSHEVSADRGIETLTCLSSSTPAGPPVDCGEPGEASWRVTPMGFTQAVLVTVRGA